MSRDALGLTFALGVVLFVLALGWRWWRGPARRPGVDVTPDRPISFGPKSSWLAVRAASADEVAHALGYERPTRANWNVGFERAFGSVGVKECFITAPVDGWVFVVNHAVADEGSLETIAALARRLERPVYGFASHRARSEAAWVVADGQAITRAWSVSGGQVVYERGAVTPEERALQISFAREPDPGDEAWKRQHDEHTVLALAKAWTRDPTTLAAVTQLGVGVLVRRPMAW
jgi:hypothetical protein